MLSNTCGRSVTKQYDSSINTSVKKILNLNIHKLTLLWPDHLFYSHKIIPSSFLLFPYSFPSKTLFINTAATNLRLSIICFTSVIIIIKTLNTRHTFKPNMSIAYLQCKKIDIFIRAISVIYE